MAWVTFIQCFSEYYQQLINIQKSIFCLKMPFPSSERAIQFAISLVMSMLAMASYNYVDNFMIIVSEESTLVSSRCSPGYFAHGTQCHPQLGCNDLISDVQVYDEVILGFSSARMIKLAEWKHKKLVKHHSLNNLNMESDFRDHLSLFKEVLHDQLIGYCDAPGHFVFITEYHLHSKAGHCNILTGLVEGILYWPAFIWRFFWRRKIQLAAF